MTLVEAITKGNLQHAAKAHFMIDAGTVKTSECTEIPEKLREKQRKSSNKSRKLLDQHRNLLESAKKYKTSE